MSSVSLQIRLGDIFRDTKDSVPNQLLKAIGILGRSEIKRNFVEGGRPTKWKEGLFSKGRGGTPLRDSGRLMNSIEYEIDKTTIHIGTNVPYASKMNYGGRSQVVVDTTMKNKLFRYFGNTKESIYLALANRKSFWVNIPARPFMVLPDNFGQKVDSIIEHNNKIIERSINK